MVKLSLKQVTTDKIIQLMDVFAREGLPEFLVTDNGVQLTSHKMGAFLKANCISHLIASFYHPQTYGIVERMNRTAKKVRGQISRSSYTGCDRTRDRLSAYHTTPNTTGNTPFQGQYVLEQNST